MAENQKDKNIRLKKIRLALKLNQQEMAEVLGIQRTALSRIENTEDNRNVPRDAYFILHKKFGLTDRYWEKGEEPMFDNTGSLNDPVDSKANYTSSDRIIELLERTISDKEAIIMEKQKRIELLEYYISELTGTKFGNNNK